MRKLMTVVAVTLVGLSASAASVTWNIDAYDLTQNETVDVTPYTLYVLAGDTASTLAAALNTSGKFDSDAYSAALSGAKKVTGTFDEYGWAEGGIDGVTDTISLLILTDGTTAGSDFYYQSGISTAGYTFEPPAGSPGPLFTDASSFTSGTVGQAGAVPEPTSGLLLLVGAGMLALRRKQK